MLMEKNRILAIVGRSGSGKTTLIERLIRRSSANGQRISVIKHARHDFSIDNREKDTSRFRDAGASSVFITDDRRFALISVMEKPMPPEEISTRFFKDGPDLVLVEGFKSYNMPKIEVIGNSGEIPLYQSGIDNIIALVSDEMIDSDIPSFKRDDIERIYNFIETLFRT